MLNDLMKKYGSDKTEHGYCEFYESFFATIRESVTAMLEIGVFKGASMRAWLDYFQNADVYGIDDGRWQREWDFGTDRAHVWLSEQVSRSCMATLVKKIGQPLDIVLDDGGHTMWGQQCSLACLLPAVKPGGLYVVEDLFTSFQDVTVYRTDGGTVMQVAATGCDFPLTTTYEVLSRWPDVKSDYMTQDEWDYLVAHVANVTISDEGERHQHSTAVLEVK